jgi:predicted nucleic acid-binding protein
MTAILVDSNVLLDVLTEDERWFEWSSERYRSYVPRLELIAP